MYSSKALKTPDMVVFDVDGTLTDVSPSAARIASVGDRWHLPFTSVAMKVLQAGNSVYNRLGDKFEEVCGLKSLMLSKLRKEQEDSFLLLSVAHAENIHAAILSNGPRDWGRKTLNSFGVDWMLPCQVFREDMPVLKPDPLSLTPVLKHFERDLPSRSHIWVFGDRVSDVLLARNADADSPHHFMPVAVEGTNAASAIHNNPQLPGHVFKNQFEMACAISPACMNHLRRIAPEPEIPAHHIDSYRLS